MVYLLYGIGRCIITCFSFVVRFWVLLAWFIRCEICYQLLMVLAAINLYLDPLFHWVLQKWWYLPQSFLWTFSVFGMSKFPSILQKLASEIFAFKYNELMDCNTCFNLPQFHLVPKLSQLWPVKAPSGWTWQHSFLGLLCIQVQQDVLSCFSSSCPGLDSAISSRNPSSF